MRVERGNKTWARWRPMDDAEIKRSSGERRRRKKASETASNWRRLDSIQEKMEKAEEECGDVHLDDNKVDCHKSPQTSKDTVLSADGQTTQGRGSEGGSNEQIVHQREYAEDRTKWEEELKGHCANVNDDPEENNERERDTHP